METHWPLTIRNAHEIELFREWSGADFPKQNGDLFRVHSLDLALSHL